MIRELCTWAKAYLASSPAQELGWLGLGWQPTAKSRGALLPSGVGGGG
jgi:hypothetical protein